MEFRARLASNLLRHDLREVKKCAIAQAWNNYAVTLIKLTAGVSPRVWGSTPEVWSSVGTHGTSTCPITLKL